METKNEKPLDQSISSEGKTIAIVSYITLVGFIIAFVMNRDKKDEYARFHIKQSMGLVAISFGIIVIGLIPILGWIISVLSFIPMLIFWLIGLVNALNGKRKTLPLFGNYFNKAFDTLA